MWLLRKLARSCGIGNARSADGLRISSGSLVGLQGNAHAAARKHGYARVRNQVALPLVLVLLFISLSPIPVYAVTYTSYENYTTGNDANDEIYAANWFAQTFTTNSTTPATSHTVNVIRLLMYREGTSGTLTVSIKATNGSGAPVGTDLTWGTFDASVMTTLAAGGWYEIPVFDFTLDVDTTYAIVCQGTGADAANCIHWNYDTAGATYVGGYAWASTTGGTNWASDTDEDYMFNVLGLPALELYGAQVYEGFVYEGDWLIVAEYRNTFEPYASDENAKDSFLLQLTHSNDSLISQVPMQSWGYYPGSIYLANSTVVSANLTWGMNYTVKLYGIESPYYNVTHTLQIADWRGNDMTILKDWSLGVAGRMEDHYDSTFIASTAAKGQVLNQEGGVMFVIGVPYLDGAVPELFQVAVVDIEYQEPAWTSGYSGGLPDWDVAVGPELAAILTDAGDILNLTGQEMGRLFIFVLYIGIASGAFVLGHGAAGMALAVPVLIAGVFFGFISWAAMGIAILIPVVLLMRQLWWART